MLTVNSRSIHFLMAIFPPIHLISRRCLLSCRRCVGQLCVGTGNWELLPVFVASLFVYDIYNRILVRNAILYILCWVQALVARTYPPPFSLTFCLQIYFQSFFFISLLFHIFFLILTCSCQYSYTLMLTTICMCRPYINKQQTNSLFVH